MTAQPRDTKEGTANTRCSRTYCVQLRDYLKPHTSSECINEGKKPLTDGELRYERSRREKKRQMVVVPNASHKRYRSQRWVKAEKGGRDSKELES